MERILSVGLYFFAAVILLALGLFSTWHCFEAEGMKAGVCCAVAWVIGLLMLWFCGPQKQQGIW